MKKQTVWVVVHTYGDCNGWFESDLVGVYDSPVAAMLAKEKREAAIPSGRDKDGNQVICGDIDDVDIFESQIEGD